MRTIIAGSRQVPGVCWINRAVELAVSEGGLAFPTEVVSGTAPGADQLGETWAAGHGVPVQPFPAPWSDWEDKPPREVRQRSDGSFYWVRAGHHRNGQMALYVRETHPGQLVAVRMGKTPGTKDMVTKARDAELSLFVYDVPTQSYSFINAVTGETAGWTKDPNPPL